MTNEQIKSVKDSKKRFYNWSFIIYPGDVPNWKQIIEDSHCPIALSPLHNMDVKETGEIKKSHYHCIIHFDSAKTYRATIPFVTGLAANDYIEPLSSKVGAEKYFTHENNKEKYQYNKADIQLFNGYQLGFESSDKNSVVTTLCSYLSDYIGVEKNATYGGFMRYLSSLSDEPMFNRDCLVYCFKYSYSVKQLIKDWS